jgi:hypothetical protein
MDDDDHVLDQDDLSDRMDHSEDARGTVGYAMARGVGRGMGAGHVVSHSDLMGTCTLEAGKTTLPFAPKYHNSVEWRCWTPCWIS